MPARSPIKSDGGVKRWQIIVVDINHAQEFSNISGDNDRRTSGRYAVLVLEVTTIGSEFGHFFPWHELYLVNEEGVSFVADRFTTIYAASQSGLDDSPLIHPNDSVNALIVFDILEAGISYVLQSRWYIKGEPQGVVVDIE